ncbi:MAG: glycine cleavage system protein GcvH [Gammaproteobacteria bacterium]|nr:glycine cleavage system protein GcvH [Gammaproteobacteria bacterium]
MSDVQAGLRYTRDHEWVRTEADGTVVVGITDHAQHQLGELVFVELPDSGRTLTAGEACAVVESVKAASDVYAPVAGTVVATNAALDGQPNLVNASPFGDGWLFRLKPDASDASRLLDAAAYTDFIAAEG